MPKYDQKSLKSTADTIRDAAARAHTSSEDFYGLSLFDTSLNGGDIYWPKPEAHEVFLTHDLFQLFDAEVLFPTLEAIQKVAREAHYGANGLYHMAHSIRATEDSNTVAIYHSLDKMLDRG